MTGFASLVRSSGLLIYTEVSKLTIKGTGEVVKSRLYVEKS